MFLLPPVGVALLLFHRRAILNVAVPAFAEYASDLNVASAVATTYSRDIPRAGTEPAKDYQLLLQVVHLDHGGAGRGTGAPPVDDGGKGTTMQD
jgi:hypothetical protein